MTTVQQFLAWVKEKSRKGKNLNHNTSFPSTTTLSSESTSVDPCGKILRSQSAERNVPDNIENNMDDSNTCKNPDLMEMLRRSGMTLQETEAFVSEVQRRAPYRASMKLPAIPREDQRQLQSLRRCQQESPCHVYEEIPAYAIDSDVMIINDVTVSNSDPNNVNMANLEFHKAKEYGPYLVVPVKSRYKQATAPSLQGITLHQKAQLSHQDILKHHQDTIEKHRQTIKQYREALPTPVCPEDDPTILGSDRLYPDELSSSDSGFLSSSLQDQSYQSHNMQSSAFLPFRRSISHPNEQMHGNIRITHSADNISKSVSITDSSKKMDITNGNFTRQSGASKSFTNPRCNIDNTQGGTNVKCDNKNMNNGSHVHCSHCSRPHGIYNGTVLCHNRIHHIDAADLDNVRLNNVQLSDYSHSTVVSKADGNASAVIFHKGAALTRCNSSPAPLNLPLSVPANTDDSLSVSPVKTSRILTNGSLCNPSRSGPGDSQNANDTCNSAKSRLSMSSSDSGNSSIYAFSGSEKDATLLRDKQKEMETTMIEEKSEPLESDCSNDTFSEYDVRSSDCSPVTDEYSSFLSKVKHNHWFKIDVQRVIRESESSEYESSADLRTTLSKSSSDLDNVSLTTVTSMSDVSVLDLEVLQNPNKRFSRTSAERRKVRFARNIDDEKSCDLKAKSMSRIENKKQRRKSQKLSDKSELYCLPEFSSIYNEQFSDFDSMERLSCRATDFKPKPTAPGKDPATTSPPVSPISGVINNYSTTSRRDQNKLLSDLMKRNHDRQLFIL